MQKNKTHFHEFEIFLLYSRDFGPGHVSVMLITEIINDWLSLYCSSDGRCEG